ncbi:hypothetical protein ACFS07_27455 [Undibacterium arcticum]
MAELNRRWVCSLSRKNCGAFVGLVGAYALEYRHAVMQRMRQHMDLGVAPIDQAAVLPNFFPSRSSIDMLISLTRQGLVKNMILTD